MPGLERFPCPCCGYRTYTRPAGGTFQICPVCFWEDAAGDRDWNGSNQVPLAVGQRNFVACSACEPEHRGSVRPPLETEARPETWVSFEDSRLQVLERIEEAFHDVKLDGGITLHQQVAIDDYQPEEVILAARRKDAETRWQDLPRTKIMKFGMSLVFLDPPSIRFHLPAFMRCSLQLWAESPGADFSCSERLLFSLEDGPRSAGYYQHAFLLLDPRQHQAVAVYLKFVASTGSLRKEARKALANGWADWLPDSFPFPTIP